MYGLVTPVQQIVNRNPRPTPPLYTTLPDNLRATLSFLIFFSRTFSLLEEMDGHMLSQVAQNSALRALPLSVLPSKAISVQGVEDAAFFAPRQTAARRLLAKLTRHDRMRRRYSLLLSQVGAEELELRNRCIATVFFTVPAARLSVRQL